MYFYFYFYFAILLWIAYTDIFIVSFLPFAIRHWTFLFECCNEDVPFSLGFLWICFVLPVEIATPLALTNWHNYSPWSFSPIGTNVRFGTAKKLDKNEMTTIYYCIVTVSFISDLFYSNWSESMERNMMQQCRELTKYSLIFHRKMVLFRSIQISMAVPYS